MFNKRNFSKVVVLFCVTAIIFNIGSITLNPKSHYFDPYYTEGYFKRVEYLYDHSQYRQKNPTSIIADEVVFRYASGAYVRGVDPILINSEHTPLGKYFIGLSYNLFQSDAQVIVLFGVLTLTSFWFLSKQILKSNAWSILPLTFFSFQSLFLNQFRVTPLLDIIQLPFILLAFVVFLYEKDKDRFFWTAFVLGLIAATKTIVPAILLIACFCCFFIVERRFKSIFNLFLWLPVSLIILVGSYTRIFLDGYTIVDFFKFQKWIFLYQQSKLIYPLSFWRLTLLNQWQTWWGDSHIMKVDDWSFFWPILVLMPFITLLFYKIKRVPLRSPERLLLIWALIYEVFLSLGITATRFLLPLLPALYILLFFVLQKLVKRAKISL